MCNLTPSRPDVYGIALSSRAGSGGLVSDRRSPILRVSEVPRGYQGGLSTLSDGIMACTMRLIVNESVTPEADRNVVTRKFEK
jgi:hypothetical protein